MLQSNFGKQEEEELSTVGLRSDTLPQLHNGISLRRRTSIFSQKTVKNIEKRYGEHLLNEWKGILIQTTIFLTVVILGGFHPLVYEAALRNPVTGDKRPEFNLHSVYVISFLSSFLLLSLLSGIAHGRDKILNCLNPKSAIILSPIALTFAVTETMDMVILERLDSASKTTVGQMKVPLTAIISVIFFGAVIPSIEWLQIFSASSAILGYCVFSNRSSNVDQRIDLIGVTLVFINMLITTFGCLGAELVLKNQKQRFLVRLAQMRLGAFVISSIFYIVHKSYNSLWDQSFFYGWTWKVVLLVIWGNIKDWLSQALIKRLDNVWKALAGSLSLCLCYVGNSIYHGYTEVTLLFFVAVLVLHVIALALARTDKAKKLALLEEAQSL